jgi:hypothetical protein
MTFKLTKNTIHVRPGNCFPWGLFDPNQEVVTTQQLQLYSAAQLQLIGMFYGW